MLVKNWLNSFILAVCVLSMLSLTTDLHAAESRSYLLATGTTGGTYYPVGVGLATLIKVKLQPKEKISMSAVNSAGSGENVKLLNENEAQLGIVNGVYGYYARNGLGPVKKLGPQKNLRAITMLWPNVIHLIVSSKYAKTGTVKDLFDLKGMKMAMGKQNSGTIEENRAIINNLGMDMDNDFDLVYSGYGPSVGGLQNGQIAGLGIHGGMPVGAVARTMASMGDDAKILEFPGNLAKEADGDLNLFTPYTIPAGTYHNQEKPIQTISQPTVLIARDDANEDDIYKITKTIYENLPFLQAIHKATNAMDVNKALNGLPMPLHKGALRYYKEIGLDIPKHLMN